MTSPARLFLPALTILLLLLTVLAAPSGAATPPTMPFDSTADLFVYDNGCDCLLMVGEDGTVTVAATEAEIAAADTGGTSVSANEGGVAVAADGTVYFVNTGTDSILSYDIDGNLATVVAEADIIADVGGSLDLEKIAFGPGGTLYVQEDSDERVLAVDVDAGAVSVLVEESDFTDLDGISGVDMNGGIAVDASGTIYVAGDGSPNAVFSITPAGVVSVLATAPNEVQSVSTDATGGTFTITFDGETTAPIAFDATADEVQTTLEALGNIDAGDVEVTGTGGATDPWLIAFTGNLAGTDVAPITTDDTDLSGGSTTVDTEIDGGSFSDFDVYGTLDAEGAFVVADDCCGGTNIYRIDSNGDVQVVLLEREIEDLIGGNADLEGGIAYDEQGRLYIAEENTSHLLRFDGKSGEIWVENSTFAAESGDTPEFDGGIAFRMPIVDISPSIDAPDTVVAGDTLTYTVTVTNDGPNAIDAFTLDTAGLDGATVSGDTTDLAAGDTVVLNVDGTVPSGLTSDLVLTVETLPLLGAIDADESNDSAEASVTVESSADLALTKDAPASLAVGDTADYTLTVTNNGPSDATDVVVTDTLPVGLTLKGTAADAFTCSEDTGTVTCTRDDLSAGDTATITLRVTTEDLNCSLDGDDVVCEFAGATITDLVNEASVTSATADPDESNNSATATTALDTSEVAADLEVLPAAGATTDQYALLALASILLGVVLLRQTEGHRRRAAV